MKKIIGIYKILNKNNGKSYIGSSINCLQRISKHKSLLKHNKHLNNYLQNSYNKNGIDNFEFSIIEICNENDLEIREQYYIDLLGNYNITKIVERNIPSETSKLKMSETRLKMHKLGLLSKTTKAILQYDLESNLIKKWESITEASSNLNISQSTILRVLNGTYKQGKGFIWRYATDKVLPTNIDFKKKEIFKTSRSKKVILTSDNEILEFDSIKLAAKYFNITRQNFIQYVYKNYKLKGIYKIDLVKSGELLETLEVDNQQPS